MSQIEPRTVVLQAGKVESFVVDLFSMAIIRADDTVQVNFNGSGFFNAGDDSFYKLYQSSRETRVEMKSATAQTVELLLNIDDYIQFSNVQAALAGTAITLDADSLNSMRDKMVEALTNAAVVNALGDKDDLISSSYDTSTPTINDTQYTVNAIANQVTVTVRNKDNTNSIYLVTDGQPVGNGVEIVAGSGFSMNTEATIYLRCATGLSANVSIIQEAS